MVQITSADGKKLETNCIGCALVNGQAGTIGGLLYDGFHHQVRTDYEVPIRGFYVIGSKRHLAHRVDFTPREKTEFNHIKKTLAQGMCDILGIDKEKIHELVDESKINSPINPSHFHMALLPEEPWMKGKSIDEILIYAKENLKTEANLNKLKEDADLIKIYLTTHIKK